MSTKPKVRQGSRHFPDQGHRLRQLNPCWISTNNFLSSAFLFQNYFLPLELIIKFIYTLFDYHAVLRKLSRWYFVRNKCNDCAYTLGQICFAQRLIQLQHKDLLYSNRAPAYLTGFDSHLLQKYVKSAVTKLIFLLHSQRMNFSRISLHIRHGENFHLKAAHLTFMHVLFFFG
jgi:hypothetical protein